MEHEHFTSEEPDLIAQHYMDESPVTYSEASYEDAPEGESVADLGEAPDLNKVMDDIEVVREELKLEQVEHELAVANSQLEQLRRAGIVGKVERDEALEREEAQLRAEMAEHQRNQEYVENWLKGEFRRPGDTISDRNPDIPIPEERQPESVRAALDYYRLRIAQINRRINAGIPAEKRAVGLDGADHERYAAITSEIKRLEEHVASARQSLSRARENAARRSGSHVPEPTASEPVVTAEIPETYNL